MTEKESASHDRTEPRLSRNKFVPFENLGELSEGYRNAGKTIAMAHGVFDLVHMGHVRHLEAARREGDILVVSLTPDRHVNKGPDRPIFEESLRAEMIGALEYVDHVTINVEATALSVLQALCPNVYVKGSDYENPDDDITGNIAREKKTVEDLGGRMVLTRDITFSSSNIINRYMDVYDPPLQSFLDSIRSDGGIDIPIQYLDKALNSRVTLIGETIIDEYRYVQPLGKPAKENIIASRLISSEVFAGGVIASARHLASFVKHVDIISILGDRNFDSDKAFIESLLPDNAKLHALRRSGVPTTRKIRYVDPSYTRKLFEIYDFVDQSITQEEEVKLISMYDTLIADSNIVVANDFGHGLFTGNIIDHISGSAHYLALNAQTNAGNQGYNYVTRWPRADFVCIDEPEARLAISNKEASSADVIVNLRDFTGMNKIIVTHGKHGCYYLSGDDTEASHVPAFTNQIVDTVGAGDAFFAIASVLASIGCPMNIISLIGNGAGAIKVGIVGHRDSVHRVALVRFLTTILK